MKLHLTFILMIWASSTFAQVPVIQKVEPLTAHPNDTILITGSGFEVNVPTDLEVWFGQVKGTVITSSAFAIEVRVPAHARLSNIEVINKTSSLSGKSNSKFIPTFQGEAFDVTKFNTTLIEGTNKFSSNNELWDISTTDLDLDGKPDIVATKFQSSLPFAGATDLMILQNTSTPGNLSFNRIEKANLAALNLTFPTDGVITGDLQGDGKPEIIVSRAGSTRNSIHILRNTSAPGTISFAPNTLLTLQSGHVATRLALRDLNRDGKPELLVTNALNDIFYIFINQSSGGTLSFNPTPIKQSIKVFASDASAINYEIEVQDFNGDELPDLVVNEFQEDSIHVFRNTSAGSISFAERVTIPTTEKLNRLASADINNDGKLDLIATSTLNSQVLVFLNQSTATNIVFPSFPIVLNSANGAWGLDVADIDGDGDSDIINANRDQSQINIFIHNGNFSSPSFARNNITTTNATRNVKAADMDGDGKPDLIYTAFNSATLNSSVEIVRNTNCHKPIITNEAPVEICDGRMIVLKTTHAFNVTYTWEKNGVVIGGETTPYLTINMPAAAGDYSVTATEGTCVVESASVTVVENTGMAPGEPDASANTPICTTGTLNLSTAAAADSYEWTGPNNFTSTLQNPTIANITDLHAGIYSLQVKVGDCKSGVTTVRVDVADLADFSINSNNPTNTLCEGQSLLLSVSNLADHTYQWKMNGADVTSGGATASLNVTADGDYSVVVTNSTLNCSKEVGPAEVIVLQTPVASFQAEANVCLGEELAFTNQSTVDARGDAVYNWAFDDGSSTQTESPAHTYTSSGTFNPALIVSYSGVTGCTDNISGNVVVAEPVIPVITTDATSVCPDSVATLSASGTFATITWSNSATGNTITVTGPGTYTVSTTDANGCAGAAEIIIGAHPVPELVVTAESPIIPLGASSQLQASGANTYLWEPAETLSNPDPASTDIPSQIANPVATPSATTEYTVTGLSSEGCADIETVIVTVEGVLGFPVSFSPNGDGYNDEWNIHAQDKPDCTLSIFDGRGRRVFEGKGSNWDGTYGGNTVPTGTYYYVFGCPSEKPITGNVLIIR